MGHTHLAVDFDANNTNHGHTFALTTKACAGGHATHGHYVNMVVADWHHHTFTVSLASAELGDPWWNHTHTVVVDACTSEGALHGHTADCQLAGCTDGDCGANSHEHVIDETCANSGGVHVHGLTWTSDVAEHVIGTALSHTHPFGNGLTDLGNNHRHLLAAYVCDAIACWGGHSHDHTKTSTTSDYNQHRHGYSFWVDSGDGGEAEANVILRRLLVGVGL